MVGNIVVMMSASATDAREGLRWGAEGRYMGSVSEVKTVPLVARAEA